MGNPVICIAREFGSGGHEIAVRTGAALGIRVYEKDLLHLACKYGELSEKLMQSADERATNPFLFRTVHEGNYHVARGLLPCGTRRAAARPSPCGDIRGKRRRSPPLPFSPQVW